MKSQIKTTAWTDEEGYYDNLFYGLVRDMKPDLVVELGTYAGHSAACLASALDANGKGTLECWDLWENYPYNKVPMQECIDNLDGLPVVLRQSDAFEAHKYYLNNSVDILMVDLSNNGDTFKRILTDWYPIIKAGGKILMEGGSPERDNIWWMKEYSKPPIYPVVFANNEWITEKWDFIMCALFPSLTMFTKKAI